MNIHGLQKMTLLDFPGKVACTVFLGGCDMRCPFCHNWELVDGEAPAIMDEDELLRFLGGRVGLLDGVAFTGGEPLLRNDLGDVIKRIREMGFLIKLDTNGNHPERLKGMLDAGLLDYVAMDVKNSKERYGETIGLPGFDTTHIEESISILKESNIDYEFRTTVMKEYHDESSFEGISEMIRGAKKYYIQSFIDRDTVPTEGLSAYSADELNKFLEIVKPYVEHAELRGVD
ncbi:MAG: anaerobic ribonucleoside-triphosphate reductase activating protein [Eubacterium sp.]|nr:anaerobic ribonucleoside-triphosphate reductase activating protein [Eubacterium sp.]